MDSPAGATTGLEGKLVWKKKRWWDGAAWKIYPPTGSKEIQGGKKSLQGNNRLRENKFFTKKEGKSVHGSGTMKKTSVKVKFLLVASFFPWVFPDVFNQWEALKINHVPLNLPRGRDLYLTIMVRRTVQGGLCVCVSRIIQINQPEKGASWCWRNESPGWGAGKSAEIISSFLCRTQGLNWGLLGWNAD